MNVTNVDGSWYCVWDENKLFGVITLAPKLQNHLNIIIISSNFGLYLAELNSTQPTRAKQINFLSQREEFPLSIYSKIIKIQQVIKKSHNSGGDELMKIFQKQ